MIPFTRVEGRAIPLGLANIDTDVIIGAHHLKTLTRTGLGAFAFETIRAPFDDPAHAGAPILLAGANFGCGSSREHAAWALADIGIRAIISPSFSDIFASNAAKNGIAPVTLAPAAVERLLDIAGAHRLAVDLEGLLVTSDAGDVFSFEMDPFRRDCLLNGWDDIALTLAHSAKIEAFEYRTGT